MCGETLLTVRNLEKYFPTPGNRPLKAVDKVSFELKKGETLGLVGESGCGKSTTGRLILRLLEANSGEAVFEGGDLLRCRGRQLREMRKRMQLIFQDPFASLNPRMSIGDIIREPLDNYQVGSRRDRMKAAEELLDIVGLSKLYINRYPGEFSGGQRQRICIARALALKPKLVVCDEPVSALDVSIRAQVVNLLKDLQEEFELTYLFISHDLNIVENMSDRIAVMYLGRIVETGNTEDIFNSPLHPYTRALLSAIPVPDPSRPRERITLEGDPMGAGVSAAGCKFAPRCPMAQKVCYSQDPKETAYSPGHLAACHLCG